MNERELNAEESSNYWHDRCIKAENRLGNVLIIISAIIIGIGIIILSH